MLTRYHAERDGASAFDLLPAIDLRAGRVVRLVQGDFERETAYADDPADAAQRFADDGATSLHVVDLDGARDGTPRHLRQVRQIVERVGDRVHCEVGGGLRSADQVAAAIEAGAHRAVIGTAALRDPAFAASLVEAHGPERLAVAVDVRDGLALGDAWRRGARGLPPDEAVLRLADAGIETFEVTAVERDGLLAGPDLDLLARLVGLGRGAIIASGGIATLDDLRAVRAAGCRGAIVGRALYEGRFTLRDAIATLAP